MKRYLRQKYIFLSAIALLIITSILFITTIPLQTYNLYTDPVALCSKKFDLVGCLCMRQNAAPEHEQSKTRFHALLGELNAYNKAKHDPTYAACGGTGIALYL